MKLIFLPVIVLVMLLSAVAGEELIAKYQAKIDILKDIDVCDSTAKERLIFMVNIGEIKRSDSLLGFDLAIRYNPNKIKITNYLTGNTLSSVFEEKSFSLGLDSGIISGFALTFNFNLKPPSGDSILIAFSAEWIGNCEDTTNLEILELNFTEEFKKELDTTFGTGVVYGYPFALPERTAKMKVDKPIITLKDNQNDFKLNYSVTLPQTYYTESLILEYLSSNIIKINDVVSSDMNAEVVSVENNKIALRLKNNVTKFNLSLNCNYLLKDTLTGYKFYINKMLYSDCSCILSVSSDSIIVNKDSTFVSVKEIFGSNVKLESDCLIMDNADLGIENIAMFDLLGRKVIEYNTQDETEIKIFLNELKESIFFIGIYRKDKVEIKKFYKCY
jgi:hypothetical protein